MEHLIFVKSTLEWEQTALNYKQEHILCNETEILGSALLDRFPYAEWLKLTEDTLMRVLFMVIG